jgi:glycosyl transferase family 2
MSRPSAAVIIPAHNESAVVGRLLRQLTTGPDAGIELDVIVVCNGCTDDTAAVAAGFPGVRVHESPVPSKQAALRLGDSVTTVFPRVYLDADVEMTRAGVAGLARALETPGVLAVSAERRLPRAGVALAVRCYYDIWERLPKVRRGIFGRGVIAVSEAGYRRIAALPPLMSDDLAMSAVFTDDERRVVPGTTVVVHPPKRWADLIRRRVRATTGTTEAYGEQEWNTDSRTTAQDLVQVLRERPWLAPQMVVFVLVTVLARRRARAAEQRGEQRVWLRDESSRTAPGDD